ncbi:ion transporter [Acinetobacter terrae]|jgi:voltage-gated potassium channel|uniref:Ion transporter n=1 Tax=Acinetobacter terrae TaxID=2731247 RepID=A0A241VGR2_9GAMM|nr:ion transporter [Acinetobacter terrae]NNG77127.1 ion transporter [Acinetobacter terrae]NNH38747.1 ion transporter [Acinetobacter terrae]NNH79333.1 ion transporter [Acinetobacter terrae]NNH89063.1 ion transporter [Acinetobacter terrae]OAL85982.1 Ion transport protein [Acinetobacter terrae]
MEFNAWYKLRRFVYDNLHNEEYESTLSRCVNIFLILLIIGNTSAVLLESINEIYQSYQLLFDAFELFSIVVFTVEYLLRFWAIAEKNPFESAWKNRWLWVRSGSAIIDLLAILPAYINFFVHIDLRFLRILRLFRLLKLTRYFVSLQILLRVIEREKGSFQAVIFILLIMIIIAAAGMYVVENQAQPEVFSSIPAAMWWAVVTLTTVGYGDVTPITPIGRFLGALITILGVGLAALPAGILANGLASELRQRKHKLELRFRELLDVAEIDLIEDKEKIENLRKEVGLSSEQTQDILLQLMHERKEEELEQEKNKYFFCPHCGHKLPD